MQWFVPIGENKAIDLTLLSLGNYSKCIEFGSFHCSYAWGPYDHFPQFDLCIILCNFTLIELVVYDTRHKDSDAYTWLD
jgi:hypothetical protein